MSKGKAPAAPDYAAAAKEQGKANVEAAMMGNPNIVSPFGTRTVSYGSGGFDQAGYDAAMNSWKSQMASLPNDEMGAFARMAFAQQMPNRDQFTSGAGVISAQDADDRIAYDTTTGNLYYDEDGAGGAASIQFATLANKPLLAAGDLLVIG